MEKSPKIVIGPDGKPVSEVEGSDVKIIYDQYGNQVRPEPPAKEGIVLDQYGSQVRPEPAKKDVLLYDAQGNEIKGQPISRLAKEEKETQQEASLAGEEREKQKTPEELQKELEERIKKIAFVDVGHLAESEARDVGEAKITEEREKTKGIKNFFKRIWKHNIAREYYRQREISRAKKEIYAKQNVYAGQGGNKIDHDAAMQAVTERFLSEFEGVVREESGEKKQKLEGETPEVVALKRDVKELIHDYAKGIVDDVGFASERDRILALVTEFGKGTVGEGRLYADNLRLVAEQVKQAVEHGVSLERLDLDFELTLGQARSGVRTEAKQNAVDRVIKKINSSLAGTVLANETVVAGAVSTAAFVAQGAARSTAKLTGFFGGIAAAAGISAAKENMRMKMERAQHLRDRAKGNELTANSPRREHMEQTLYQTESAEHLTSSLHSMLYVDGDPEKGIKPFANKNEFDQAVILLTEIEGRINLSNKEKIDLIAFSNVRNVEIERSRLEIEQARAKAFLAKACEDDAVFQDFLQGASLQEKLNTSVGAYERALLEGEIKNKDRIFRKMKAKAVAKAAAKGVLSGLIAGTVVQEVAALAREGTEGVAEHLIKGTQQEAVHVTPLEQLRGWIAGKIEAAPGASVDYAQPLQEIDLHRTGEHFRFPVGTSVTEHADGTVTIISQGKILADHIPFEFDPDGVPTTETLAALERAHIVSTVSHEMIMTENPVEYTPKGYIEHSDEDITIKRDLWYDNNTKAPIFDKNELKTHWGGERGTGIDTNGNYVLNVSQMTAGGSYHGAFSADAKALAEKGELKLLLSLSKDTQTQVFEVPIDIEGNAIVDPNSEVGKIFFSTENGRAVFNGKYAEIAQMLGPDDVGTEHVAVLSTVVGDGVETIDGSASTPTDEIIHDFRFEESVEPLGGSRDVELPPVIPLVGRRPLEPMKEGQRKVPLENKGSTSGPLPIPEPEEKEKKEESPTSPTPETKNPKETQVLSFEEYQALQDDLKFINQRIQSHEGIITVKESDFRSEHAQKRYRDLEHIPEGKDLIFNPPELRTIGDELEDILSRSRIEKTAADARELLLRKGASAEEYKQLYTDMAKINTWHKEGKSILEVNANDLGSNYAKRYLVELQEEQRTNPTRYHGEFLTMGDDLSRTLSLVKARTPDGKENPDFVRDYRRALTIAYERGQDLDVNRFYTDWKEGKPFALRNTKGRIIQNQFASVNASGKTPTNSQESKSNAAVRPTDVSVQKATSVEPNTEPEKTKIDSENRSTNIKPAVKNDSPGNEEETKSAAPEAPVVPTPELGGSKEGSTETSESKERPADASIEQEKQRLVELIKKAEYQVPNTDTYIRMDQDGNFLESGMYDQETGEWKSISHDNETVAANTQKYELPQVRKLFENDKKLLAKLNAPLVNDILLLREKIGGQKALDEFFEKETKYEQRGPTFKIRYSLADYILNLPEEMEASVDEVVKNKLKEVLEKEKENK